MNLLVKVDQISYKDDGAQGNLLAHKLSANMAKTAFNEFTQAQNSTE